MIKDFDAVQNLMFLKQEDIEWDSSNGAAMSSCWKICLPALRRWCFMSTTFLLSKIWKKQKKLNMLIIFETSLKIKGRVSWTSCAVHSVQASKKSESQKLHHWKLKLIYSAALGWEGHSSFSVFHNGNSSLFMVSVYN